MAEPKEREALEPAPAKVNLGLRLVRRRADGYHDVETLIVPLDLADTIVVRMAPGSSSARRSFTVAAPREVLHALPAPEENLAWRAADAFERALADVGHAAAAVTRVHVDKRIPVAAGLGGGSADAAAVLRAANRLAGHPLDDGAMAEVAASLGSDVPAMLARRPVVARGRGEVVEPATAPPLYLVLVPGRTEVRAADAYGWWDADGEQPGPALDALLAAALSGDVAAVAGAVFDDLQRPVARRHPEVAGALADLVAAGALSAVMSGSGPSVFGIAPDRAGAHRIAAEVDARGGAGRRASVVASVGSA